MYKIYQPYNSFNFLGLLYDISSVENKTQPHFIELFFIEIIINS
jgi:hypothetical protein